MELFQRLLVDHRNLLTIGKILSIMAMRRHILYFLNLDHRILLVLLSITLSKTMEILITPCKQANHGKSMASQISESLTHRARL